MLYLLRFALGLPENSISYNMINIERIRWMYENFGLAAAIKSAAYDLVAILAFMGYCLTLPFQFVKLVVQNIKKESK